MGLWNSNTILIICWRSSLVYMGVVGGVAYIKVLERGTLSFIILIRFGETILVYFEYVERLVGKARAWSLQRQPRLGVRSILTNGDKKIKFF